MTECPDIQTLAAFAEGTLKRQEMAPIVEHVQDCVRCMAAVEAVVEGAEGSRGRGFAGAWWYALAAAIVIAVIGLVWLRPRDPMARLVALSPADARIVEPRLSGDFAYAPYRGTLRGSESTDKLKLGGAAAELIERADRDPHAAGVAMLLVDREEQAIEQLRVAAERAPNDAKRWNDLAAARYTTALDLGRPSLYPEALAAADRALRVDPKLPAALFNRALILERMGLAKEGRAAWERYLAVDPSSKWAVEAREHLARGQAGAPVLHTPPRALAEAELLGKWGEAMRGGDAAEAARQLAAARATGDQLAASHHELLLRDAIRAIDAHPDVLAEAHEVYRRGRIAYSKQNLGDADRDLRQAAMLFEKGQSPMALMARYYAASVRYDRGDAAGAASELEPLLAQPYEALTAHARWELALCRGMDDDYLGAQALLERAESQFAMLGERANLAAMQSTLASALVALGRPDDAWAARIRSFRALSETGDDARLAPFVAGAARMSLRAGQRDAASALMQIEESLVQKNDVLLVNTLAREAVLQDAMGDPRASQTAAESARVAQRIAQPELRARAAADAQFAEGAAAVRHDPRRARGLLSSAIEAYRGTNAFLPETHLLRARASLAIGDTAAAADDLERGITAFERQRVDVGTGVLDAGMALYDEAIELALDRGDQKAAFGYAERQRCRTGPPTRRGGLENRPYIENGVAVLELHQLRDEVVSFCITERGMSVTRQKQFVVPDLPGTTRLIVIPDPRADAPLAALYEKLLGRMSIAVATSAASLVRGDPPAAPALLSVALPAVQHALPEASTEAANIYANSVALPDATFATFANAARDAQIIHIAGHTERQRGAGDVALLFANDERVSWKTIAARHLDRAPIVVLAACETLRASRSAADRTLSLGEGFLAAGASAVIGTLTPIADRDAGELFRAVHRRLASGADAAEALREAQLEFMQRGDAWKSVAVLVRRIPIAKEKTWATSPSTSTASARTSTRTLRSSR